MEICIFLWRFSKEALFLSFDIEFYEYIAKFSWLLLTENEDIYYHLITFKTDEIQFQRK